MYVECVRLERGEEMMTRDEVEDALTSIRDMFLNDQIVKAMSRLTGHELEPKEYEILNQLKELASGNGVRARCLS